MVHSLLLAARFNPSPTQLTPGQLLQPAGKRDIVIVGQRSQLSVKFRVDTQLKSR